MMVTSVWSVGFSSRMTGPKPCPVTMAVAVCMAVAPADSTYRLVLLPQS